MRLHRFYIEKPVEYSKFEVNDSRLIHQWRDVFRYNTGSEIIVFDGSGMEYDCVIEKMTRMEADLRVYKERKGMMPDKEITLCQSIIKKDKMEWVAEKATELGVSKIVPILSERSEKKNLDLKRMKKIVIEAAEQCGRADVPVLEGVKGLEESIKDYGENAIVLDSSGTSPSPLLSKERENQLRIFIGPEGGWSEKEIAQFHNGKLQILSLGKLTLRAETAAVVAIACISLPLK